MFGLETLLVGFVIPVAVDWVRQRMMNSQMKKVIDKSSTPNSDFCQLALDEGFKMLNKSLKKSLK